jgi:hypothetical protein
VDDFQAAELIVVHMRVVVLDKLLDGLRDSVAVQIKFVIWGWLAHARQHDAQLITRGDKTLALSVGACFFRLAVSSPLHILDDLRQECIVAPVE